MLNKKEEQGFLNWLSEYDNQEHRSVQLHRDIDDAASKILRWVASSFEAGVRFGESKWKDENK